LALRLYGCATTNGAGYFVRSNGYAPVLSREILCSQTSKTQSTESSKAQPQESMRMTDAGFFAARCKKGSAWSKASLENISNSHYAAKSNTKTSGGKRNE
jgi:hypothetical protein